MKNHVLLAIAGMAAMGTMAVGQLHLTGYSVGRCGTPQTFSSGFNGNDLIATADGGTIAVGFVGDPNTGCAYNGMFGVRSDRFGVEQHSWRLDDQAYTEQAWAVESDNTDYVVFGTAFGGSGSYRLIISKHQSSGSRVWTKGLLATSQTSANPPTVGIRTSDGYVGAASYATIGTTHQFALARVDVNGQLLWTRRYDVANNTSGNFKPIGVAQDGDGFLIGLSKGNGGSALVRVNGIGEVTWAKLWLFSRPSSTAGSFASAFTRRSNGDVVFGVSFPRPNPLGNPATGYFTSPAVPANGIADTVRVIRDAATNTDLPYVLDKGIGIGETDDVFLFVATTPGANAANYMTSVRVDEFGGFAAIGRRYEWLPRVSGQYAVDTYDCGRGYVFLAGGRKISNDDGHIVARTDSQLRTRISGSCPLEVPLDLGIVTFTTTATALEVTSVPLPLESVDYGTMSSLPLIRDAQSACREDSWPCVGDVDDGTGRGIRDGGVGIEDLLYYTSLFESGVLCADVDDGGGTGTPDGGVGIEDFLYYLQRFESGC